MIQRMVAFMAPTAPALLRRNPPGSEGVRTGYTCVVGTDPFDQLMASLDPAMAIVTAAADGERSGCLVGFHCQSGIGPAEYSVWISKANHTFGVAQRATHLAVHFLTEHDLALARTFATLTGDEVDKFALVDWAPGAHGAPRLTAAAHGLVGEKRRVVDDGGDHVAVALAPVEVWGAGTFAPLRLSAVEDLEPGHASDERR